jgi:hypothetical protein
MKGGEKVEEVFYFFTDFFVPYLSHQFRLGWAKIFFEDRKVSPKIFFR